jgi:malate dehydrogenase
MIARGAMLGPDQPVILHMLDIPPAAKVLDCRHRKRVFFLAPISPASSSTEMHQQQPMLQPRAPFNHGLPQALEGVRMELVDAAFPLLMGVVASTDAEEACKGVDVAVMVGGFPRKVRL